MIHPCDAIAPPSMMPDTLRIPRHMLGRKKRRSRCKLLGENSGREGLFYSDGGDNIF